MVQLFQLGFYLLFLSLLSCEEKDQPLKEEEKKFSFEVSACNTSIPAEKLDWLKTHIGNLETELDKEWRTVKYFEHEGKSYFEFGYCHPAINYQAVYRNCEGELYELEEVELALGDLIHAYPGAKWVWCASKCDCKN